MVAGLRQLGARDDPVGRGAVGGVSAEVASNRDEAAAQRPAAATAPCGPGGPHIEHLLLRFAPAALERDFREWWAAARAPVADAQGAAVYLAMVRERGRRRRAARASRAAAGWRS